MWTLPTDSYVTLTSLIEDWSYTNATDSGLERASKATLLPFAVAIRGLVDPGGIVSSVPPYDPESLIPEDGDIGNFVGNSDMESEPEGELGEQDPDDGGD